MENRVEEEEEGGIEGVERGVGMGGGGGGREKGRRLDLADSAVNHQSQISQNHLTNFLL